MDLQMAELKTYDTLLCSAAKRQIEINLDDGVDTNYGKFARLLAKLR
ncbi:hypothetical protein [Alicyclobacillus sp. SO9]|nr:hypothetical protein [Alicyclobacillus sp. SO9]